MSLRPEVQSFLDALAEQNPPSWDELSLVDARAGFAGLTDWFVDGPQLAKVRDGATAAAMVRIYDDHPDRVTPLLMYFHGGGWVLGDVGTHDGLCRHLAQKTGCVVASVDFDPAPENRFPGPLDQCYRATAELVDRAGEFAADPCRVAVAGDSAGGNLAAATAIKARDEDGPSIALQVLLCPVIEPNFDRESYRQFATGYALTADSMKYFWRCYLGDDPPSPAAAPIMAGSLARLPPAIVVTAQYDVLRDEGQAYAAALRQAGVATEEMVVEGTIHGFIHFAGAFPHGLETLADVAAKIHAHLS